MSVHPSSREAAPPGLSARAWFAIACVAVVLAAAVLRFAGLAGDMPFSYHPDEPVNLTAIQGMLRDGTANPKTFVYGSLFYYLHVPANSPSGCSTESSSRSLADDGQRLRPAA